MHTNIVVKNTLTPDNDSFPRDVNDAGANLLERLPALMTPSADQIAAAKRNPALRRRHNRDLALGLAAAGYFIFPVVDKTPVVKQWPIPDTDTVRSPEEDDYRGCTRNADTIRAMWRQHPDATPAISCGPSRVVVLDADSKHDGPSKLRAWFEENGIDISQFPTTHTRSGGLHVFIPNDTLRHGCSGGIFKAQFGTDVKGIGGQVVAPGAIRADGAAYVADPSHPLLGNFDPTLCEAPPAIAAALVTAAKHEKLSDDSREAALIERLKSEEWPDGEKLLAEQYELDRLGEKDARLAHLLETGGSMTHSEARWHLALALHAEYGRAFDVLDYAGLIEHLNETGATEGAFGVFVGDDKPNEGEFSYRSLARDFYRSENEWRISTGDAFTPVEGEDDEDESSDEPTSTTKFRPISGMVGDLLANWQAPGWIVKDLLPASGVALIVADANVGKSWLLIDWLSRLSLGMQIPGAGKAKPCGSIYITAEGAEFIPGRFLAWQRRHEKIPRVFLEASGLDLVGDGTPQTAIVRKRSEKRLIEIIAAYEAATGERPRIVALDTLSACCPLISEIDNDAVKAATAELRKLGAKLGVLIVITHHTPQSDATRIRGATAWRGMAEVVVIITDSEIKKGAGQGRGLRWFVNKLRDGAKGVCVKMRLQGGIPLGVDDDGDAVTGAVMTYPEHDENRSACFGAVGEDGDLDAPTLLDAAGAPFTAGENGETPPPAVDAPETPGERKARERVEALAAKEAKAFAQTKEGRHEWLMRALAEMGNEPFRPDELRLRANVLRAGADLAGIERAAFRQTNWPEICAARHVEYVSGATCSATYRRTQF